MGLLLQYPMKIKQTSWLNYIIKNDRYMLQRIRIPYSSILILEGVFLQRKELKNYFDFTIYLDVSKKNRLSRVLVRDDI